MSKRKGRKPARTSEIKSVLEGPREEEAELDPARGAEEPDGAAATDADSETLPLDVLAEAVEDEPNGEPEAPPEVAGAKRPRRLRAVPARDAEEPATDVDDAAEGSAPRPLDEDAGDLGGEDGEDGEDGAEDDEPFAPFPIDAVEGDDTEGFLRGLLEALLFTSQKPLDLKDLARSAGVDKPRAKELLEQLIASYEGRGLCIEQIAGGFVMRSSPRYAPYIQKILALRPVRLSRAQLETLAIVAYRQPVTKPEVDDIRGVDSGQVIKGLLERSLLKMLGKKDEPGRPTLYGTTNDFLDLLNLQSLKDLPTLREYTELSEESQRKFLEETGEAPPSGAISFERPVESGVAVAGMSSDEAGEAPDAAVDASGSGEALGAGVDATEPDAAEVDAPESAGERGPHANGISNGVDEASGSYATEATSDDEPDEDPDDDDDEPDDDDDEPDEDDEDEK